MNNLFSLTHGNEENDFLAAKIEVPIAFRIHKNSKKGKSHNTRTVKGDYILRTGSHHGFGINALFAYRLYQDLSETGSSIERLEWLHACNLEALTSNPYNLSAIVQCMPKGSDAVRMIEFAYPGSLRDDYEFEKSDFAYFVKSSNKPLKGRPGSGMVLIADIYTVLQRCNRIKPDEKLQKKLEAIRTATQI